MDSAETRAMDEVTSKNPALRFAAPIYPGGRMCLLCGNVTVGAVFPPAVRAKGTWKWRLWISDRIHPAEGAAKSELAAKNAMRARFEEFLRAAQLKVTV